MALSVYHTKSNSLMAKTRVSPKFHFALDRKLKTTPLVEAWLTIQWKLEEIQSEPLVATDPGFNFSFVQRFFEGVKSRYNYLVELDISRIPIEITPHQPRYQFRKGDQNSYPLLQIGPGVATVNFTKPYTWEIFKPETLLLRSNLLSSYTERELQATSMSLRYRNAIPCKYSSDNALTFLKTKLNTPIQTPKAIPGNASKSSRPTSFNFVFTYELREPSGIGLLRIASGSKKEDETGLQEENIIFEIEIISKGPDTPALHNEQTFESWLEAAHYVIHDWFFSLIDGDLYEEYAKEE
jgi:uncharacterized protein (TIGR04255 family)